MTTTTVVRDDLEHNWAIQRGAGLVRVVVDGISVASGTSLSEALADYERQILYERGTQGWVPVFFPVPDEVRFSDA